ncbi:hypothetical protein [Massilia phosphatilytica]
MTPTTRCSTSVTELVRQLADVVGDDRIDDLVRILLELLCGLQRGALARHDHDGGPVRVLARLGLRQRGAAGEQCDLAHCDGDRGSLESSHVVSCALFVVPRFNGGAGYDCG